MPQDESESYTLTPFGLLTTHIGEDAAQTAVERLELYMRRFNRIIVIDDNKLQFVSYEQDSEQES